MLIDRSSTIDRTETSVSFETLGGRPHLQKSRSLPRPERGPAPLTTFAVIWACATLLHLLAFPFWARTWQGWFLVMTVGVLLGKPSSLPRFSLLVTASALNLFRQMPFVPNHFLFEGMVHVTIITSIGWVWLSSGQLRRSVEAGLSNAGAYALEITACAVYLALIIVYQNEYVGGIATGAVVLLLTRNDARAARQGSATEPAANETRTVSDPKPAETAPLATAIYRHFAPIARLQLVVMYYWAVIQKLNWDYLDPAVSAAATLHREIASFVPLLPTSELFLHAAIYGSLLFEAGIPLLLLFRRTRTWGFVAAVSFHAILSLHPHPGIFSFSALIYAMLVLFLPEPARVAMCQEWKRQRTAISRRLRFEVTPNGVATAVYVLFFGLVITFAVLYETRGEDRSTFELGCQIATWAWFAWAAWMAWSYLRALADTRGTDRRLSSRLAWSPALIGVVLVVANGCMPWIGLKTQTAFSMFSNLRTEFASNHLFLSKVDLFPHQSCMVEVISTSPNIFDPKSVPIGIELYANTGSIISAFELRRLLSRWDGDVEVVIQVEGETQTIARSGSQTTDPVWFEPHGLIPFKFLWFRRHETWDGPMHCTH